ncbi:hypothetical protein [Rosettibacter firmus]|uniref:hypothetical protein n=1 Tax=Rosettibacter firmus TaxID=3111522 RepID=UPI00336BB12D
MANEYKYLEYMLNPPKELKTGQMWKCPSKGVDFIITEIISDKVVRASLITPIKYLADENDVSLKDDSIANEVFAKERFVIRITDGVIPTEILSVYIGTVEQQTILKINNSLKITTFNYDEVQKILLNELLESLTSLRERALEIYEEDATEPIIITLPKIENYESADYYLLAAHDSKSEYKNMEFWDKERVSNFKNELPINISDMILRLSCVDDKYYLIIITDKHKNIDKIEILENGESFLIADKLIIPDTNRYSLPINKQFDDEAFYTITLTIDDKDYYANFLINYE